MNGKHGDEEMTEEELELLMQQDDGGIYADTSQAAYRAKSGLDAWYEDEND